MTDTQKILQLSREKLLGFCSLTTKQYSKPKHLRLIANLLEKVERGESKRLIITIPPRHGKSMLCSEIFPAWYLGRNPEKYIMTVTYGQELADDFGRKVRDKLESPLFKSVFPACEVRKDTRAASRMNTSAGGSYFAVGVGGSITGKGAHLLLIDDPIKNREEADSADRLTKINEWYSSVAYTRLMPDAAVVVIMTRWSEDDLVGHLLKQEHEGWEIVNLPAIDEEQKRSLWPEQYSYADMMRIKHTIDDFEFTCLYQQNPLPKSGIIFQPEWLNKGFSEKYGMTIMAVDPAISEKETADETAVTCIGIDFARPFNITELRTEHGRWNVHEQRERIKAMYNAIKPTPTWVGVEKVGYQAALGQLLLRDGLPVLELDAIKDKKLRANEVIHYFAQGRVRVNTTAMRDQLMRFRGKNEANDLVDALVHSLRVVHMLAAEEIEEKMDRYAGLSPEEIKRKKIFEKELIRHGGGLSQDMSNDWQDIEWNELDENYKGEISWL